MRYGTHNTMKKVKWTNEQTQVQTFTIIPHWLHYIRFIKIFDCRHNDGALHNEQLCLWTRCLCVCVYGTKATTLRMKSVGFYTLSVLSFSTHTRNSQCVIYIVNSLWLFRAFSQKGKNSLNIIKWKTEKETHHFDMVDVMNSSREHTMGEKAKKRSTEWKTLAEI